MYDPKLAQLTFELERQLADYWHEIDTNGGREAHGYYTDDAVFHGEKASYQGKAKIQEFYDWRIAQGPRLAVHSFTNFRAWFTGEDTAESSCYLFLYAKNGVRILPSHPPISISMATDKYRRVGDRWLCTYRRFEHWFEGDTPITNPKL